MKIAIVLIGIINFFSLFSTAQNSEKDYILTLSVDLYINTSSQISCDNFATNFKSELRVSKVSLHDSIEMFLSFIKNAKYERHNRSIDVRRKFIYELNNIDMNIVCANAWDILIDGRLIKRNKKFLRFLNSLVK